MADISRVTLPDGNSYNFKDAELRNKIPDVVGDVTATDPTAVTDTVSAYYTKEEVNKLIPDVSGFQTADQVNTLVGNKGYQTSSDVDSAITTKLNAKITISTADPTGGSDGDLWFKYEE